MGTLSQIQYRCARDFGRIAGNRGEGQRVLMPLSLHAKGTSMKKTAVRAALVAATVTMLTGVAVMGAAPASATEYAATFVSPSGNISCYMSTYGVRCDIEEAQWR